jgi:ribA/ribD-fused uncharacterized protein
MKTYICPITNATLDVGNKRIFFWGSVFSQWYKAPIFDSAAGVTFNTAEQGMMYYKAMTFNDTDIAQKILATDNARKQKELGRKVTGYNDELWAADRFKIVSYLNYLKFSQNADLKVLLLMLKDWEFVESSADDKIWGIGIGENNPDIFDSEKWQGQNLLGKAIKEAQQQIINEL